MTVRCTTPRGTLAVLTTTALLFMSTWFSATAVIPHVRVEWQLSTEAVAWMTIAVQWGFVAGALLSAAFTVADAIASNRLIFLCSLGAATANLLLLTTDGVGLGVTARFATGFFIAGIYPPALKLISTWYRRGRGTALGVLVGALSVSQGVPHLVNGLGGLDWRTVIVTTSVLTVAGGVIIRTVVREGPFPFPGAVFDPRQVWTVLRDRGTRLAMIGYLCHMWELYAMWAWFSVFFAAALHRRGLDEPVLAAYVTFAVFVAGGLANWSGGALGDRIGRERAAIGMMAASGACAATIGLLIDGPLWLLVAVGLVWGYSVVGDSTQFSTLVTELADQSYVGTALTVQMALGFLLTGATIWLVPAVEQAAGWYWALALLAIGPLAGIVAMVRLLRSRWPQTSGRGYGPGP